VNAVLRVGNAVHREETIFMKNILCLALLSLLIACSGCALVGAEKGPIRVGVVTGGHGFDEAAFFRLFDGLADAEIVHVPLEDESEIFEKKDAFDFDVLLLYNMTQKISDTRRANFLALLDEGLGLVVLHHAIAAFQEWPEFERIIGAKYLLEEEDGHGVSAYEHDVEFRVQIADPFHPITRDLASFAVHDETYRNCRFAGDNHLLCTTAHGSSDQALVWVRTYRKARVCYIQMGHGPTVFDQAPYRRLVGGAIGWAAGRLE